MAPHWLLVVPLAFAACGSDDRPGPAPAATQASGSRQVPPDAPPVDAPVDALDPFTNQVRDPKWAVETERGIHQRFVRVRGAKLRAAECRHDRCRLVIAGTKAQLAQTITDLQGPRGLSGFAASVVLGTPELKADGSVELRVIARFAR
ncbi:MAG: hypothetical protein WKG01_19185 [Kofleriaceae bacterium]